MKSRVLAPATRNALSRRLAVFNELVQRLSEISRDVPKGVDLLRNERQLSERLSEVRARNERLRTTRAAIQKLAKSLKQRELDEAEPSDKALARLRSHISLNTADYTERESSLTALRESVREMISLAARVERAHAENRQQVARLEVVRKAVKAASRERGVAKRVAERQFLRAMLS